MHIPDAVLNTPVCVATAAVAVVGVGFCLRKVERDLRPERVPMLGVMGAFLFAAQMVNFPVLGGTSGHLMGTALATVLLGPHAAVLVMTTVLLIQCFLAGDGGLTTLGANILNMALVPAFLVGFIQSRFGRASNPRRQRSVTLLAAWASVVVAALLCSAELVVTYGRFSVPTIVPMMLGVHALIGVGEGLLTLGALAVIARVTPELTPVAATEAEVE